MTTETAPIVVDPPSPPRAPWILKVCGATGHAEISAAARGGADHVGLWYGVDGRHELSRTTLARLASTCRLMGLKPVLVTLSHDVEHLVDVLSRTGIGAIQLHAYQSPAVVARLADRLPHVIRIKVLHVGPHGCLESRWLGPYARSGAQLFLLDRADDEHGIGSTGQPLPVHLAVDLADRSPVPVWLAGGLSSQTPAEDVAVLRSHPRLRGIDVDTAARRAGRIAWPAVQRLATHWQAGRPPAATPAVPEEPR